MYTLVLHHQSIWVHSVILWYSAVIHFHFLSASPLRVVISFTSQNDIWQPPMKDVNLFSCVLHVLGKSKRVSFPISELQFLLMNAPLLLAVLHYGLLMLQSQEILISLGLLNLKDGQSYLTFTADILNSWKHFCLETSFLILIVVQKNM